MIKPLAQTDEAIVAHRIYFATFHQSALQLYDAHVHLTDLTYAPYLEQLILGMSAMKIVACCVAVDYDTSRRGLNLKKKYPNAIRDFIGIHPETAGRADLGKFEDLLNYNLNYIDGIGEIGLDRSYEERGIASLADQQEVFSTMLSLAETRSKPVSIHSRKSLDEILSILPSYKIGNVLLHWFAGSKKQLAKATDMGLYVSFGPATVYSVDKQILLQLADRSKVLVETDGPVSYSHCFGGLVASPTSFLVTVVMKAAQLLSISYADAVEMLEKNATHYLGVGQR